MIPSSTLSSEEVLLLQLAKAHDQVEVGAIYTHYRNHTRYKVTGLAILEATQEVGVLYHQEAGSDPSKAIPWIRPISSFLEKVHTEDTLIHHFQKNQP
ncbi:MAG: DUF1653 domain-containing protein [Chlamydiota bacterium]